jgi:arylsulfatase A-like enzyme
VCARCKNYPNFVKRKADEKTIGVKFEHAFLTSPQSSPSRTSMLTGKFAHTIGTEDLHVPLDTSVVMLPEYLRKAGYTTAYALKTHWGDQNNRKFNTSIKGGYQPNQGGLTEDFFNNYASFIERSLFPLGRIYRSAPSLQQGYRSTGQPPTGYNSTGLLGRRPGNT